MGAKQLHKERKGSSDHIAFPLQDIEETINKDKADRSTTSSNINKSHHLHSAVGIDPVRARVSRKNTIPPDALSNARRYDLWRAGTGDSSLQVAGPSSVSPFSTAAPSSLPAAGSLLSTSVGGALLGSAPKNKNIDKSYGDKIQDNPRTNAKRHNTNHSTLALQWNMNGFFINLADLELLIADSTPAIIAIQEVHRADTTTMGKSLKRQYDWILKGGANSYHSS